MRSLGSVGKRALVSLLLSLALTTLAVADGVEGTWRLVKRQLPDGTVQTPPTVVGLYTLTDGLRHFNLFFRTSNGKTAAITVLSKFTITAREYTETTTASSLDDGSGKPVVYDFSAQTKTTPVTRDGGRISYKLPFEPPTLVFEGDKMTATAKGMFVDYWERLK